MKKILFAVLCSALFCAVPKAQTTYTIDFSYETINANCNVFASATTVDNFVHKSTIGFPKYTAAPDYFVDLPCKRNSQTSQVGTEYQIIFPFKKDYRYTINAYYKGTKTNTNDFYPLIGLGLNETEKAHNTATTCTGPQSIQFTNLTLGASGPTFAWAASPMISTTPLSKNYASLSVAGYPWEGSTASGNCAIQVRAITIVEYAPFSIAPATAEVNCGFPLTQTFTLYSPPGTANITGHSWSLGSASNNWLYNGLPAPATFTTAAGVNSITLTSTNNAAPSNVSGTVLINGSPAGAMLTSTVTFKGCPTISPTSVNVACNVVSTPAFTLTNSGSINGVTGTRWSLGPTPNGWIYSGSPAPATINTTGNSISLTSVPGTVSSNVVGSQTIGASVSNYGSTATVNYNNCACMSIGTATNPVGTPATVNGIFGFYIHFNPVAGATGYVMDWFDVSTNSQQTSGLSVEYNVANVPGNFYYYLQGGHTYKFRIAAIVSGCQGAWGPYSSNLTVTGPAASCATGPTPSSLNIYLGCASSPGCPYTNFNWPAISGASQYQVEYVIFNAGLGITRSPVSFITSLNNTGQGITPVSGSGWAIKYRVKANCSGTWGNYSGWSSNWALY